MNTKLTILIKRIFTYFKQTNIYIITKNVCPAISLLSYMNWTSLMDGTEGKYIERSGGDDDHDVVDKGGCGDEIL